MIVRSIRLKNIKSYGEGSDGVTVTFQAGVNRIAGRNGHGKSTLIEALGYALFYSEPDFQEGFKLPTYLVKAGEKQGEINVVFEHEGKAYRVERSVGQSKRRSKVIDLSDESTCAMDDAEVASCLGRLLGFRHADQMRDLFSNLVGVKQGRLTRPFDSKPSAAKEFFEPLLDVGVFRESTALLGDSCKRFKELLQEHETRLAAVAERIRFLTPAVEKLPAREKEIESLTREIERSRKQKEQAGLLKTGLEQKQKACDSARSAAEEARNLRQFAAQSVENDRQRLNESVQAVSVLKETEAASQAYVKAEEKVRALLELQKQQAALLKESAHAQNTRTEWEGKMAAAQRQAQDYLSDAEAKSALAANLTRQLEAGKALESTQAEFEQLASRTASAKQARANLTDWISRIPGELKQLCKTSDEICLQWKGIESWDADTLSKARSDEEKLSQASTRMATRLAQALENKKTLEAQLAQIAGGVCPFLKEKCRQFDSRAVQSDIAERDKTITEIKLQEKELAQAHSRAKAQLQQLLDQDASLKQLRSALEERLRSLLTRFSELFPASARHHIDVLREFLPSSSVPFQEWKQPPASEDLWQGAPSVLDSARLNDLCQKSVRFFSGLGCVLEAAGVAADERIHRFELDQADRVRQGRDLENARKNLEQAQRELKDLEKKRAKLDAEARNAREQAGRAGLRFSELEEKLKGFSNVEPELRLQHELQDKHRPQHQLHLGSKSIAEKIDERKSALEKSTAHEAGATQVWRQKTEAFDIASRDFDSRALDQARDSLNRAEIKLGTDLDRMKTARAELQEERDRARQWRDSCSERERIESEMRRLQAAGHLAKTAGKVLKDAAPIVAQHLCNRIAANAQSIVNRMNPDPVELEWKAEPQYSVRISPGERRFAMLSGGEQTKIALAMTLAMIEQFSSLKFAVFDEPTYGVDAESREKLADAIIAAQHAAGFDQLILVTHDNAFDGKIEHVVSLTRKGGETAVAINP